MKVPKDTLQRLTKRNEARDYQIDPKCRWCGDRLETLGQKRRHELVCKEREG